jgi:hypothetical protein
MSEYSFNMPIFLTRFYLTTIAGSFDFTLIVQHNSCQDYVTMLHAFDNVTMLHAFDNATRLHAVDNVTMFRALIISRCYMH